MGTHDSKSQRPLEEGIERDFSQRMSYGDYLRLDLLLAAQQPQSQPPQHDELLFIIQHQTSELWLKLLVHELRSARDLLRTDDLPPALKRMARVKHILRVLTDQWSVLATMTPSEYAQIRPFLATSSGFQSGQYREVEFLLGNKSADMVDVFRHDPPARAGLAELLGQPSLYDEFLAHLARAGLAVPSRLLERDWSQPYRLDAELVGVFAEVYADPQALLDRDVTIAHTFTPELVPVIRDIYEHAHEHWEAYEACEELV
ncbi:MAG: tryptophan 2,3-dioxygenase, partial [Nocardioides sp.]